MRTLLSFLRRQESIQLILHPSPPSRRGRTEVGVTSILSFSQRFRASEESHHFCHSRMPVSGIQLLIPHFERARNHHTSVILPVRRSFNEDGNLIQDLVFVIPECLYLPRRLSGRSHAKPESLKGEAGSESISLIRHCEGASSATAAISSFIPPSRAYLSSSSPASTQSCFPPAYS